MKRMKKSFWVFLLAAVMAFSAMACGANSSEEELPSDDVIGDEVTEDEVTEDETPASDVQQPSDEGDALPAGLPENFIFSSGAGAWSTGLTLSADGTFEGFYHDSEMGEAGDDYPDGTVYLSEFSGKFGTISKINDWSYALILTEITLADEVGTEWIEENIRYVASDAHGIAGGTEFVLYTPEAPTAELSEDFLSWHPQGYIWVEEGHETLECYAICNLATGGGFYAL